MTSMICPRCWGARHEPGAPLADCLYCQARGVVDDTQLSEHFLLSEMLVSETAQRRWIPNDPPPNVVDSLREWCRDIGEPLRAVLGAPIVVTSGYRSPSLNAAIGGSATSMHPRGNAVDLHVPGVKLRDVVAKVLASDLPYDQVIYESSSWVHIGRRGPGGIVRREALMMFPRDGRPMYSKYDANDPRVCA